MAHDSESADAELAARIQHTEVGATADRDRVLDVLDECIEYGFDGAMVQPCWVPLAADRLSDTDVKVCTAVGYPMGGDLPLTKATGIRDAVAAGADELDVMANISFLKSGEDEAFQRELETLVEASGDATIKLMLELGGLTDEEAEREIEYAVEAGFDYLKNSSGFGAGGKASVENVSFIAERVPNDVGVKASGGIKTAEGARDLLDAGADLLGASSGVQIVTSEDADSGGQGDSNAKADSDHDY
ncbi:deoxyribose-phosphate aldolase [Halorussus litoreus]|uniref:deoxyribose-phosphate aldolase n=1 Tax=Halorussus litoreus TaxID=1710536 RepID=UPI000E253BF1|nr:deoxyribose-phosphate aldolase [Halorussus litoreus]